MNTNVITFFGFCTLLHYPFKDEPSTGSYFQDTSSFTLFQAVGKFIYWRSKSCHGDLKKNPHSYIHSKKCSFFGRGLVSMMYIQLLQWTEVVDAKLCRFMCIRLLDLSFSFSCFTVLPMCFVHSPLSVLRIREIFVWTKAGNNVFQFIQSIYNLERN